MDEEYNTLKKTSDPNHNMTQDTDGSTESVSLGIFYFIWSPKHFFRKNENLLLKRNTVVSVTFYYTSSFKRRTRNLRSHVCTC